MKNCIPDLIFDKGKTEGFGEGLLTGEVPALLGAGSGLEARLGRSAASINAHRCSLCFAGEGPSVCPLQGPIGKTGAGLCAASPGPGMQDPGGRRGAAGQYPGRDPREGGLAGQSDTARTSLLPGHGHHAGYGALPA